MTGRVTRTVVIVTLVAAAAIGLQFARALAVGDLGRSASTAHAQSPTMFVSNLTLGGFPVRGGKYEFRSVAWIEDTAGNPVEDALVEGTFYGECHKKPSTDSDYTYLWDYGPPVGEVAETSLVEPSPGGCRPGCIQWIEITNVSKTGYSWDPDLGVGTTVGTLCRY